MNSVITVTPAAAHYVSEILTANPQTSLLVGYDNRGCSGHKYTFELIPQLNNHAQGEVVAVSAGDIVVHNASIMGLLGSVLDLVTTEFESQLVWTNPQATDSCGCGASFKLNAACDE